MLGNFNSEPTEEPTCCGYLVLKVNFPSLGTELKH